MTEIAVRPNTWGVIDHQAAAPPAPAAVSLSEWVEQAREVANIADMLCRTSFVPKAFFGKPAECAAAILAGQEMGMAPMASLRAIDVIEGKPGLSALGLRAQVQSKGHDIWTHESTATRATVKGRRKGSDKVESSTWTIERAGTFGLLGKKNWREQPTSMLLARATGECARLVAADALLGMPYSTEELSDGGGDPTEAPATEATKPARRTARRAQPVKAEPAAEAEPDFDDEPAPTAEPSAPAPDVDMVTDPQMKLMHALFNQRLLSDRDDRLAYVSKLLKRDVATSSDLTKSDAGKVIDALENNVDPFVPEATDEPPLDEDEWPAVAEPGGEA